MCVRCEWLERRVKNLEEKVLYLGDELGYARELTDSDDLRRAFDIGPTESRILFRLYKSGVVLTMQQLSEELLDGPRNDSDRPFQIIEVFIHRLRSKLPQETILRVWGIGYRISPAGRVAVASALTQVRAA